MKFKLYTRLNYSLNKMCLICALFPLFFFLKHHIFIFHRLTKFEVLLGDLSTSFAFLLDVLFYLHKNSLRCHADVWTSLLKADWLWCLTLIGF